ncbi:hypothetical protein EVG20_g9155 [Dentipellis fragilis]|uniref:Uncharacterized protein n=1 Tax=Dentipellis fragilis TaxID=205917 RepID=A0A4Y9Y399_9AGAM|nr:hypothetical protein EVG20_g9155 [Dentipellis fragilis]
MLIFWSFKAFYFESQGHPDERKNSHRQLPVTVFLACNTPSHSLPLLSFSLRSPIPACTCIACQPRSRARTRSRRLIRMVDGREVGWDEYRGTSSSCLHARASARPHLRPPIRRTAPYDVTLCPATSPFALRPTTSPLSPCMCSHCSPPRRPRQLLPLLPVHPLLYPSSPARPCSHFCTRAVLLCPRRASPSSPSSPSHLHPRHRHHATSFVVRSRAPSTCAWGPVPRLVSSFSPIALILAHLPLSPVSTRGCGCPPACVRSRPPALSRALLPCPPSPSALVPICPWDTCDSLSRSRMLVCTRTFAVAFSHSCHPDDA